VIDVMMSKRNARVIGAANLSYPFDLDDDDDDDDDDDVPNVVQAG